MVVTFACVPHDISHLSGDGRHLKCFTSHFYVLEGVDDEIWWLIIVLLTLVW